MNESQSYKLIEIWWNENKAKEFGEADKSGNMALLGMDSIDIVEFCEYLEVNIGLSIDPEWLLEFNSLKDLSVGLAEYSAEVD